MTGAFVKQGQQRANSCLDFNVNPKLESQKAFLK